MIPFGSVLSVFINQTLEQKKGVLGMETGRIIQTSATTVVADLSHSRESALWLTMETRKYKGVKQNTLDAI